MKQYKKLEILQKVESSYSKDVCDICVEDNHTYLSDNGIINHNSGILYNSSITLMLSTAKLDDRESDKIAEKKVGDFVKTGVIVTAKPEKSRFTIPQKVRFIIPFFTKPNPYVGLDQYLTWDNCGIMVKAKLLTQKEFDKLTTGEQDKCSSFVGNDGVQYYAYPKDTAKTIVIRSECRERPLKELFTPEVLTDDVLRKLDEEVIRPLFELPNNNSTAELDEVFGEDE